MQIPEINLHLRVTIGLTDALAAFVSECLGIAAPTCERTTCVARIPENPAAPVAAAPTPAPTSTPKEPAPAVEPETPKTPKEEFMAIIDATRLRIEGPNHATRTDALHRSLTGMFKVIAAELGAAIPSQLPADKIPAFRAACGELVVDANGTLTRNTESPF